MKLPKIFIPEKSLDKTIETLKAEKAIKYREIEDIFSLLKLPEDIGGYTTNHKTNQDKKIPAYAWCNHFKDTIRSNIVEAGIMAYSKTTPSSVYSTFIYALDFSNDNYLDNNNLDSVIKRMNINQGFIYPSGYAKRGIKCLKRENYLVAMLINNACNEMLDDLQLFKNWYINNFGMVEV